MMKAIPNPKNRFNLNLRSIMSAGESVGVTVIEWAREQLGVTINEMFGQTEINYVVGNCQAAWPVKPGSIGRPYPGHRVAVIDDDGRDPGRRACQKSRSNAARRSGVLPRVLKNSGHAEFVGDWACTDQGRRTTTATLVPGPLRRHQERGYRIGPAEIETCLVKDPAVANAAVIGKPDAVRGSIVKAFIVLQPGNSPSNKLIEEIQNHVRGRLAPYEYPREIEFIDALPMTTTGKVQRKELRKREEANLKA
jgi:acetyl-CoA synthetase